MDDIMPLKKKHMKIPDSQIIGLLQNQMKIIDDFKEANIRCCNEDEMRIAELTSKIATMKETLKAEKKILEQKNHELSKELDCITELEVENNKLQKESHLLELQRNKLRSFKQNLQDQELLNRGRRKFALYKELTRIRWDYEQLKENIAGYVTDKKIYIHHFCYTHENINDLCDLLWKEIYQSTMHTAVTDTHNKENTVQNKKM